MFEDLNNDNYLIYAMKAYDKPNCVLSEFKEDFKRFNYIKRLFNKYDRTGDPKELLVLNHIIVIYNVFGVEPSTRLLFFRMGEKYYSTLKTYLLFLNYMPDRVKGIKGKDIYSSNIMVDLKIAEKLRQIK